MSSWSYVTLSQTLTFSTTFGAHVTALSFYTQHRPFTTLSLSTNLKHTITFEMLQIMKLKRKPQHECRKQMTPLLETRCSPTFPYKDPLTKQIQCKYYSCVIVSEQLYQIIAMHTLDRFKNALKTEKNNRMARFVHLAKPPHENFLDPLDLQDFDFDLLFFIFFLNMFHLFQYI